MKNNVFQLSSVSEEILTKDDFLRQLEIEKKTHEHSKIEEEKKRNSLLEKEWNRMLAALTNKILQSMLKSRSDRNFVSATCLLGQHGIQKKKNAYIREYNGWIGYLEKVLREQKKLNGFSFGGDFHLHFWNTYGLPAFDDTRHPIPSSASEIRFYRVSDSAINDANNNKNTYVFVIMKQVEKLLKENGYKVENTLELVRRKGTKFVAVYSGGLEISAE